VRVAMRLEPRFLFGGVETQQLIKAQPIASLLHGFNKASLCKVRFGRLSVPVSGSMLCASRSLPLKAHPMICNDDGLNYSRNQLDNRHNELLASWWSTSR
jgi:hypothetical protein